MESLSEKEDEVVAEIEEKEEEYEEVRIALNIAAISLDTSSMNVQRRRSNQEQTMWKVMKECC